MSRLHVLRAYLKRGIYSYAVQVRHYDRVCVSAPDRYDADGHEVTYTITRTELAARLRAFRRYGYRIERINL